jgi:hypothetical protein
MGGTREMKKAALLCGLIIILCYLIVPASGCRENSNFKWRDVPDYPNADLMRTRSWATSPEEGVTWSNVEWHYYLTDDIAGKVDDFYKNQMQDKGWRDTSDSESSAKIGWYYYFKLNLYVDMSHLEYWRFYSKDDEKESAMIWVTLKEVKPEADKIYIDIGGKSYTTSFIVLRTG